MSEHTKGGWKFNGYEVVVDQDFGGETSDSRLAAVYSDCNEDDRTANGHLIAAAPDLLAACEFALDEMRQLFNASLDKPIELMEKAIAKAKGIQD